MVLGEREPVPHRRAGRLAVRVLAEVADQVALERRVLAAQPRQARDVRVARAGEPSEYERRVDAALDRGLRFAFALPQRPAGGRATMVSEILKFASVPVFTGLIGYATNWTGVWMLFEPVEFAGIRIPGLAKLVRVLPRKIQQIPGVMNGGLGWQGIIPSRASKMGSISVDKGIAKVGSASEFYEQLDPSRIAEHILET